MDTSFISAALAVTSARYKLHGDYS